MPRTMPVQALRWVVRAHGRIVGFLRAGAVVLRRGMSGSMRGRRVERGGAAGDGGAGSRPGADRSEIREQYLYMPIALQGV